MAADAELLKLVLQIQGQEDAENLRAKMAKLREEIAANSTTLQANDPHMVDLARQMRDASEQAGKLDREFGQARSGMAGFGQSALQTGRVVQDFAQGGIGGILNNIEGLTQALGGGAGLAGVLTLVGVGLATFKPQLVEFFNSLTGGRPEITLFRTELEKLHDRIKELEAKPIKLTADVTELEKLKDEQGKVARDKAALEAMGEQPSELQAASGAAFMKAMVEPGGGKAVVDQLKKEERQQTFFANQGRLDMLQAEAQRAQEAELKNKKDMAEATNEIEKEYARVEAENIKGKARTAAEAVAKFKAALVKQADDNVAEIRARAAKGDDAAQQEMIRRMREISVPEKKIRELERLSPEGIAGQRAHLEFADQIKKGMAGADKDSKEALDATLKGTREHTDHVKQIKAAFDDETKSVEKDLGTIQKNVDEAAKEAEKNARLLGGGRGGVIEQGEAFLGMQARRRAQANMLPPGERERFLKQEAREGRPILSEEGAKQSLERGLAGRMQGMMGVEGAALTKGQAELAAVQMVVDVMAGMQAAQLRMANEWGEMQRRAQAMQQGNAVVGNGLRRGN